MLSLAYCAVGTKLQYYNYTLRAAGGCGELKHVVGSNTLYEELNVGI